MSKDLWIFLLGIALPSLLLTLGGIRLIRSESEHLDEADLAGLESAAAKAVADVRMFCHDEIDPLLDEAVTKTTTNELHAAIARLEAMPWAHRAYLGGERGERIRRGLRATRDEQRPTVHAMTAFQGQPLVVELEPLYILSRMQGVFRQNGLDDPADMSRLATIVEVRQKDDALLLPASSCPPANTVYGEAPFGPILPNWKVRVFRRHGEAAFAEDRTRFMLMGGILLLLLVSSLVAGGMALLRTARKARRDALEKTDFISTMSHEFKTPLTTIGLCTELALENELDEDERRRAAQSIQREAGRLQRLLQGILDFSRLEAGRRTYSCETFDLAELVRASVDFMKGRLPCEPHVADDACEVYADRDAVDQILVNLLDNAVKYAGKGVLEIFFGQGRRPGLRAVHFADRGPGLTPAQRKHVFDRFWRADDSTTREQGGTGIGLSIARGLARGMNGDLTVRSRAGGGCIFTLELPAVASGKENHG